MDTRVGDGRGERAQREALVGQDRPGWIADAERLDRAVYGAIARTETPSIDRGMRRLARA